MIRTLLLTSSRADFGIYLPLIKEIKADSAFDFKLMAFGTHLSKMHGHTIDQIVEAEIPVNYQISSLLSSDNAVDIASAYALTALKFADFWQEHQSNFDVVIVLGDRYEMAAAVASGIPFNINFAHIHGGETTLGAIDNIYRHSITLASKYHFVSIAAYQPKIEALTGSNEKIYIVGALGLAAIKEVELLSLNQFKVKWNIDLSIPSILVTAHPETVGFERNSHYAEELKTTLIHLMSNAQVIVTMPNADTAGSIFRTMFQSLKESMPEKIHLIENFGSQSYFSCMHHSALLIGNTSSGITEAASFQKYVINLGDRQKGRITSENVIHVPFDAEMIIQQAILHFGKTFTGENIYFQPDSASKIKEALKSALS